MDRYCTHCRQYLSTRNQLQDHIRSKHPNVHGKQNSDRSNNFENYCAKLGYSRDLARNALRQLGPSASTNDLLEVVLKKINAQKHEYFKRGKGLNGLELNKRTDKY